MSNVIDTVTKALGVVALAAILFVLLAFLFSLPVYWLWNWLMPAIFGLGKITWLEAVGVLLLSGLLFKSPTIKS